MELPPFLLDRWIEQKQSANPPIEYDLASSTGPVWTLRELLALPGGNELDALLDTSVVHQRCRHSGAADCHCSFGRSRS